MSSIHSISRKLESQFSEGFEKTIGVDEAGLHKSYMPLKFLQCAYYS